MQDIKNTLCLLFEVLVKTMGLGDSNSFNKNLSRQCICVYYYYMCIIALVMLSLAKSYVRDYFVTQSSHESFLTFWAKHDTGVAHKNM